MLRSAGLFEVLRRRTDPLDAAYDARFAAAVDSLEVRSPFDLVVRFRQVPLRPESLFSFPLPPRSVTDEVELEERSAAGGAAVSATWPFELKAIYDQLYADYKTLYDYFGRGENDVMKRLKKIRREAKGDSE